MNQFRYITFISAMLLFVSCAQVGEIYGGKKDVFAPKIKEIEPKNESLNFTSKKIVIKFDEYIKLNNPLENIVIVPRGIKIASKVDKKNLILELDGELEKNTTYQITFNSVVQDFTESNDSLMQYVFSSGDKLDTLNYRGIIADAYTGERQKNVLVGLYQELDSINLDKASYFAKTNLKGEYQISYLKEGNYKLYAFADENKDMLYQVTEKVGFKDSLVVIRDSFPAIFDSLPTLISLNLRPKKIVNKSYVYPRLVRISATYSLENTNFIMISNTQNLTIEPSSIFFYSSDSISVLLPEIPLHDFSIFAISELKKDTLNFKVLNYNKVPAFSEIQPANKDISKSKSAMLVFANEIASIDTNLISVIDTDSNYIQNIINYDKNTLVFKFPDSLSKNISVHFKVNSINFKDTILQEKISYSLINKAENEFGSLLFKSISLPDYSFVEFILNGKVVLTKSNIALNEKSLVDKLAPGEYSFRIIKDLNSNSKWDPSSVFERKQAEKVLHFSEKVTVRANWETEIEFDVAQ